MWFKINELVIILQNTEMIKYKNKTFELPPIFIKFSKLISENKSWQFSVQDSNEQNMSPG